jgi:hypothetical protein
VPELADIFRATGAAYREANGPAMSQAERKAMRDIEQCRTEALGGQLEICDQGLQTRYSYHSCRNRHCPKCQGERTRRWLEKQRARLLPVPYYLLTFTLPAELRPVARSRPALCCSILFQAAAAALLKLTADEKFLGATPGITGVLHTWTRAMLYHPHVHFLVTAGGLGPDGQSWVEPKNPRFLVPGYALSAIFRAKVRDAFDKAGLLRFRYRDHRTGQVKRRALTAFAFIARFLLHGLPAHFTKVRHYGIFSPSRSDELQRLRSVLSPMTPEAPAPNDAEHDETAALKPRERCPACQLGRLIVLETFPSSRSRAPP